MTRRVALPLALLGLLSGGIAAVVFSPAEAGVPTPQWCDDGREAPCIVSAFREGVDLHGSGTYTVFVDTYSDPVEKLHNTGFTVAGASAADVAATFAVTLDTGDIKPRIVSAKGLNGKTSRWKDGGTGHWMVKVWASPAEMLETCSNPGPDYCPVTAPDGSVQYQLNPHVDDAFWYSTNPAEADKLNGLDQFSNINLLWYPPTITTTERGGVLMDIAMQNSHYYPVADGHGVFYGKAEIRLPNQILRELYGIPNPETMVNGSFASTSTSGSVSSFQEAGDDAWRINLSGVTFSKQHLRLKRGTITPTRPVISRTTRASATSGRVAYQLSKPRGARVKGYDVRCVSGGGAVVTHTKTTPTSPITIGGLTPGTSYTCKVRARSKVGPSSWSVGEKLAARP
jgi:hypothetical protein